MLPDPVRGIRRHWPLAAILMVAAVVRLVGAGYGLPAIYNPDEVAIMNRAIGLSQNGLNPHNFLYPTLYFYALFAWEGLWFLVGRSIGVFGSLADFERSFFTAPTSIYLAGRILSVLCGVWTVWACSRLGTRLFGRTSGLSAAVLLAIAPLAVRDAHYVKHDVPVTLLLVLTHLALASRPARPSTPWAWALPGVLGGLAMSTHYYAIFVAVPIALLAVWPADPAEPWSARVRRVAIAGAGAALAFFAGSPFLLTEPGTAIRDMVANRAIVIDRLTETSGAFGALRFYVRWLGHDASGTVAALLALIGLVAVRRMGWKTVLTVTAFPVAFLLFVANTVPASRYLNPILPFVAILGGFGVSTLLAAGRPARRVGVVLLIAAIAESASLSLRNDWFFRQADTRTLALQWVEGHLPAGSTVLIQPYSVPLRPSRAGLIEALDEHLGSADRASIRFRRQLDLNPYPSPAYRTLYLGTGGLDVDKIYIPPSAFDTGQLDAARDRGVTYVALKRYNVADLSTVGLATALRQHGRLLASFSPYRQDVDETNRQWPPPFLHNTDARIAPALDRPGPIIEIWTID